MGAAATPSHVQNEFSPHIAEIERISIDELVSPTVDWTPHLSKAVRLTLESVKDFVSCLKLVDVSGAPAAVIGETTRHLQNLSGQLLKLVNSSLSYAPDQVSSRIQTYQNLRDSTYPSLFNSAVPLLVYNNARNATMHAIESRAAELLLSAERKDKEQLDLLDKSRALFASQQKFAQEIAVKGYGTLFAKEAHRHQIAARIWLGISGFLALLVAGFAGFNYYFTSRLLDNFSKSAFSQSIQTIPSLPASLTLQFAIAKIVLFTIGLSAAYWAARVYRSNRHNAVVNQHRANALTSFETFVASTSDPEVKNAVLLQTTSCIYAPQPTAFASGTEGDGESPLKVLEVVRNFQK